MDHQVTIALGQLALDALSAGSVEQLRAKAGHAIRYYVSDKDANRPGWAYPRFLSGEGEQEQLELSVTLDSSLWTALREEAAEQHVSPEQLARHAVLYFVADEQAGKVPGRIRAA